MLEGNYARMYANLLKKFNILRAENKRILDNVDKVLMSVGHSQVTEEQYKTLWLKEFDSIPLRPSVFISELDPYINTSLAVARSLGLIADPPATFEQAEEDEENPASQDESDGPKEISPETGKTSGLLIISDQVADRVLKYERPAEPTLPLSLEISDRFYPRD